MKTKNCHDIMKPSIPILCAIIGSLAFSCISCTQCGSNSLNYDHSELYTPGGTSITDPVESLSIDWVSGSVVIEQTDDSCISFSETANRPLSDTTALHWHRDHDGELNIQFARSGKFGHKQLENLNKQLVVRVPRTMALDEINISSVSADVRLNNIRPDDLDLDMVSGSVLAVFDNLPKEINIECVSSDVTLLIPPSAGFTLSQHGVSCEFETDIPTVKHDKKSIAGDGACDIDMECVSGKLTIRKK